MNFLTSIPPHVENAAKISVYDVVGYDGICVASEDGVKVYEQIAAALKEGKDVILSFKDVQETTPAFLSDAIARLYANFPEGQIESSLSIVDIHSDDTEDIGYVVEDMKEYLKDPQRFIDAWREVLGDDYV